VACGLVLTTVLEEYSHRTKCHKGLINKKSPWYIFIGSVKLTDGDFGALSSLDMTCSD
jgi:hypothetical protein